MKEQAWNGEVTQRDQIKSKKKPEPNILWVIAKAKQAENNKLRNTPLKIKKD